MTLADIKNHLFKNTGTNATSYPAADMVLDINAAANRVNAKIKKYLDNFRPTAWTTSELSTGTAEPKFDADFHELIPLYATLARANAVTLPGYNGFLERVRDLEKDLDLFYGARNYEVFTVTIASPGVLTKKKHSLQTGDRVTLTTTGTLPTGLAVDTFYFVVNPTEDTFQVSATNGGTAINTSVSQSGTHYYASDRSKGMRPAQHDNR
jgi:hypothetical protein